MGTDIAMFSMAGDLNSIVFKSENSVGDRKSNTIFCSEDLFIRLFSAGTKFRV